MNEFKITSRNGEDGNVTLEDGTGNQIHIQSWTCDNLGFWTLNLMDGAFTHCSHHVQLPSVSKKYYTRDDMIEQGKKLFPMFKLFVGLMPKLEKKDV